MTSEEQAPTLTPEERARPIAERVDWFVFGDGAEWTFAEVTGAIRKAIEEEREACALLLERIAPAHGRFDRNIAGALLEAAREIRARGES